MKLNATSVSPPCPFGRPCQARAFRLRAARGELGKVGDFGGGEEGGTAVFAGGYAGKRLFSLKKNYTLPELLGVVCIFIPHIFFNIVVIYDFFV